MNEFVIKNGFISKGDSIVSGSLSGETLNLTTTPSNDNSQTQVLVRNNTTGIVEYRDASSLSGTPGTNTFVTGTTFGGNQAILTRNDGTEVFKLSGSSSVQLSNPSGNKIDIDVTIPAGMNTYVTGFTYDDVNTFTITDNLGTAFTANINVLSATTISATTFYGDGSNLTDVPQVNFANTDLTFTGLRQHDTNGNYYQVTTDGGSFLQSWFTMDTTNSGFGFAGTNIYMDQTFFNMQVNSQARIQLQPSESIINGSGLPIDFRVESTGSTHALFVDASTDNVGIGVAIPTEKLDVLGSIKMVDGNQSNGYVMTSDANGVGSWQVSSGSSGTFVTGFTYDDINTFTINDNAGSAFTASINVLSATTISATTFYGDGSNLTGIPHTTDTFVSGGTYSDSTDIITFTNTTGGTFNVTGVTDKFVTGGTYNPSTVNLDFSGNSGFSSFSVDVSDLKDDTNTFVTGYTYDNNNTFTINDNAGSAFTATINQVSGLTVNGKVITTQLQVTNSPTNGYVLTSDASGNATWQVAGTFTGGTVNGETIFTDGLSANTINITTIPNENNDLIQILGRNTTTGDVEYRSVQTIGNNITTVTGTTYSATTTDDVIGVDSSINGVRIYLPDSTTSGELRYDIKDIGVNSFNNPISIVAAGSDTIITTSVVDSFELSSDGGAIILVNNGIGQWWQM